MGEARQGTAGGGIVEWSATKLSKAARSASSIRNEPKGSRVAEAGWAKRGVGGIGISKGVVVVAAEVRFWVEAVATLWSIALGSSSRSEANSSLSLRTCTAARLLL